MNQKVCFLVCPIGEEGSEIRKNSDSLLSHIVTPIAEVKGYSVVRADKIMETDTITTSIINYLQNAELVIADLTGKNPNVFYELGYRVALGRPVIQIMKEGESLPFDVSGIRTYSYDLHDLDKVEKTKQALQTVIDNIETRVAEMRAMEITTDSFGTEVGQMIATSIFADMVQNPQNSAKYVDLIKNLQEMKKVLDEAKDSDKY